MNDQYYEGADFEQDQVPTAAVVPNPLQRRPTNLMPQENVDTFWEKFTTKTPGKVRCVLPSDVYAKRKALKTPKGEVNGERAVKSYDEAARECKYAVQKIAKECRRVNHKYRDQHFDIEFDLKRGPRDCLNGLRQTDDTSLPGSVKRVPDIFKNPQFYIDNASASDVRQGSSGDCWFLAAVCAISNKKNLIDRICVARDEVVGVYGFVFHRDGEWCHTIIDDKLYLTASDWWESSDEEKRTFESINRTDADEKYRQELQTGSKALFFAQCREENETWLPLLEKAFAKAHGDFSAIEGGFTGEGIEDLTGGVTTELFTTDILDKDQFWNDEIMKVNDKFLFSCATGTFDHWQGAHTACRIGARSGIVRMHAYSIMEAVEIKGQRLLKVRNPWGTDEWRGAWSDGSEQWTPEWMQLLNHRFGDDGMFWISYEDLLRKYSEFERTRLFDQAWTITQQWTTVNVPWSADYNDTKFTITITKPSPVVIVLSQLDDRYFQGMEGQYQFQLHFRLDKDGEQDYIVRSHGNYSMNRSVSTDLELDPGTYSVLMRITATRNTRLTTPENVIRENCKNRQNKLIQVGLSYDLAHAKGEIVETEEEKQRRLKWKEKKKATARQKARAALSTEQRKVWECGKRLKAKRQRHAKKKEEYLAKKRAQKQEAAEAGDNTVDNEAPIDSANSETKEQANSGATQNQSGEVKEQTTSNPAISESGEKADSMPTAPVDDEEEETKTTPETEENEEGKATPETNSSENPIPEPDQREDGPLSASALGIEENDYRYDSSASFHSSIDSVLDFSDSDSDDEPILKSPPPTTNTDPNSGNREDQPEDPDKEFEDDPWNAVVVVGLRVYSKDEWCCIKVVRPRTEEGDEEAGLEVDDVSKGICDEKDGEAGKGVQGENAVQVKEGI